jgi:hypothetical protein
MSAFGNFSVEVLDVGESDVDYSKQKVLGAEDNPHFTY